MIKANVIKVDSNYIIIDDYLMCRYPINYTYINNNLCVDLIQNVKVKSVYNILLFVMRYKPRIITFYTYRNKATYGDIDECVRISEYRLFDNEYKHMTETDDIVGIDKIINSINNKLSKKEGNTHGIDEIPDC